MLNEKMQSERTITDAEGGSLKDALVGGQIDALSFLTRIDDRDQSDPERSQAEANLEILTDPTVANYFATQKDPVAETKYHRLVSVAHFHIGQHLAFESNENARIEFAEALEAAENVPGDASWRRYVKATLVYLDNIPVYLKAIYMTMPDDDKNKPIIRNFIEGLKKRSHPNYKEDYAAPRSEQI